MAWYLYRLSRTISKTVDFLIYVFLSVFGCMCAIVAVLLKMPTTHRPYRIPSSITDGWIRARRLTFVCNWFWQKVVFRPSFTGSLDSVWPCLHQAQIFFNYLCLHELLTFFLVLFVSHLFCFVFVPLPFLPFAQAKWKKPRSCPHSYL